MAAPNANVIPEVKSWSDVPLDIIRLILSYLPLSVYPIFASVCKSWSSVTPPIYPADHCPLLMHYNNSMKLQGHNGICYYNPLANKFFIVDFPKCLSGTHLHFLHAKDGWLTLPQGSDLLVVNVITGNTRKFWLEQHLVQPLAFSSSRSLAFSSSPSSSDCIAFAIASGCPHRVHITTLHGDDWTMGASHRVHNNLPFLMSVYSTPVFLRGCFYCLGSEGNLAVFNVDKATWTVLSEPEKLNICFEQSFLVESKGELLSVFIGELRSSFYVFRLNQREMSWEKVESLDDQTLFVDERMCILTTTSVRKLKNKLCISMVHGKPEYIEADMKTSEGRLFFVAKAHAALKPIEDDLKSTSDGFIYHYDLKTGEQSNCGKLVEFSNSIWFEPKIDG